MSDTISVYAAISSVQKQLSQLGIAKDKRNQQQGFNFRGIDDVYNAIAPMLSAAGLCILPRVISREFAERTTSKGGKLYITHVHMEFDFVGPDGSKHTISAYGEGMDSGDKSTPKAMSAAHKYAILQTFTVPTEGMPDADRDTYETDENELLQAMQEAALQGVAALKSAHEKLCEKPGYSAMWAANKASLKDAAEKADTYAANQTEQPA